MTRFTARLPDDVLEWLKEKSIETTRSMNGQMVEELKAAMQKEKALSASNTQGFNANTTQLLN